MSTPVADHYDDIALTRARLRKRKEANSERLCFKREGMSYDDCWCKHAGPNNTDLPCPPLETA